MNRFSRGWLWCTFSVVVMMAVGCASEPNSVTSADAEISPTAVDSGWQKVVPGGETQCSDGSEFAFYTRAGDPTKLVFFLQGGGGCWNLETCDPLGKPSYTVNLDGFHPSQSDGIFNFSRRDNPVRDHTMVFVPYCSGDVHIGAATRDYKRPADWVAKLRARDVPAERIAPQFSVAHKGLANGRAALKWVREEIKAPASVLVTGSSAGSIPSPYYALQLANQFPAAQVSQLGDGSGGYRRMNQSAAPQVVWNTTQALSVEPEFAELDDDTFNFEKLYVLAHKAQPKLRLHAYDTAEDNVQLQFLRLSGLDVNSLEGPLRLNQADIRQEVPTFQSYIAAGELHTILRRPEFYEFTVGERSVRDWLADIVAGETVSSVSCTQCSAVQP